MNRTLVLAIVMIATATGCSTTGNLRKSERLAERRAMVTSAVESGTYVIRMNNMTGRYGLRADLRPSHNFIVIKNNQIARISLGYMGRSYDIMQINGINMEGEIIESSYEQRQKNMYRISMKVKENNDIFDLNINIGRDGYCDVGIIHHKIDYVTYRGEIYTPRKDR
ncbi:MAG: DUF4251 domain-containing protein [Bacteroidales bacterium]